MLSCLCLQALSGPWIWQAHCQDGHHEAGAHLPPQSICGGVGCAGACTHVSSHVRPEDNVRHLLPSLSKLSFETRLSLNPELLNCLGCCVLCGFVLKPNWGDEGIKEGQIHRHVCRKAGGLSSPCWSTNCIALRGSVYWALHGGGGSLRGDLCS